MAISTASVTAAVSSGAGSSATQDDAASLADVAFAVVATQSSTTPSGGADGTRVSGNCQRGTAGDGPGLQQCNQHRAIGKFPVERHRSHGSRQSGEGHRFGDQRLGRLDVAARSARGRTVGRETVRAKTCRRDHLPGNVHN